MDLPLRPRALQKEGNDASRSPADIKAGSPREDEIGEQFFYIPPIPGCKTSDPRWRPFH